MKIHHPDIWTETNSVGPGLIGGSSKDTPEPLGPALTSILAQSHDGFLHYLQIRLGDGDEAKDVLQDFYLRVVIKAGQIRDAESVMGWLRTVLKSVLVDHIRRRSAARRYQQEAAAELMATTAKQEHEFDRAVCTCFYKLLPTLKAEYAEILRHVYLAGESRHEAALTLGISTGNVRVRLHRARQALKGALQLSCVECRSRGCFDSQEAESWQGQAVRSRRPSQCNALGPNPSYQ